MRIYVTDQHITDGSHSLASNPVALALVEQLDRPATVSPYRWWIRGLNNEAGILAPPEVALWLESFMSGDLLGPFEFEFPDEILRTAEKSSTITERLAAGVS